MNLRQIVRNQKLSNFDYKLAGFLVEQDKIPSGKKTGDDPHYWYKNKRGEVVSSTDKNASRRGYVIASKEEVAKQDEPKDTGKYTDDETDVDTSTDGGDDEQDIEVDIDDEARDFINQEMEARGFKPHPEDENSFVDDEGDEMFHIDADGEIALGDGIRKFNKKEQEGYADYIEDVNDRLYGDDEEEEGEEEGGEEGEEEGEEGYDWRAVTIKIPEDERPTPEQINDLRLQMFGSETGRSSDWAGMANSTPNSKPPSDAIARQTALDTGFPKKGTKPWPFSKVTGQDAAPAPGNAGSQMNEVFSVEGCNIAEAFYERFGTAPTVEEMEALLDEQFSESKLARDNGGPKSPDYMKKLKIAAQASVTKFDRLQNAQTNNPEFGKMIRPPSEFYGAADSIEAQAAMIRDAEVPPNKIYGPAGPIEEITDNPRTREELIDSLISIAKKHHKQDPKGPYAKFASGSKSSPNVDVAAIESEVGNIIDDNNVKQFVELLAYAGGGGANPSDTATFARSESGNLMVLFHSDKMSTEDQQANSTLGQEARRQEAYLNELIKSDQLDDEQKEQAQAALDEFVEVFERTSEADDSVDMAPAILKMMKNPKKKEALIAGLQRTAEENPNRILIVPQQPGESSKDFKERKAAFLKKTPEEQRSPEQIAAFLKHFAKPIGDPPEGRSPATGDQGKFFQKLKGHLGNDSPLSNEEMEKIDSTAIGAERTKEVVGAIQARLAALDEITTKDGIPVGQYIETKNIIDKLHLYAMDDPSSLAYQSGMCATVIGNDVVNREVLRDVFGVESSQELIGKVKVGNAAAPEDDWVDPSIPGGVKNSLIQRSTDTFVKTADGDDVYFTVDEDGKINGTTTDPDEAQMKGKPPKPVQVGVPTGQKSLFYAVLAHGEDCMFALQAARSKEGPGKPLQTAYTYGACMREGIEKYGKESTKEESVEHKLANILFEAQENTLAFHWKKAEDDYPLHYFLRDLNEGSLN